VCVCLNYTNVYDVSRKELKSDSFPK